MLSCGITKGMGKHGETFEMTGVVKEALPGATFRVELENGAEVLGHLAGRLRRHRIRILPGDDVRVEMSPYDLGKARIVYRGKPRAS